MQSLRTRVVLHQLQSKIGSGELILASHSFSLIGRGLEKKGLHGDSGLQLLSLPEFG